MKCLSPSPVEVWAKAERMEPLIPPCGPLLALTSSHAQPNDPTTCVLHRDFRLSDAMLPLLRPSPELLNHLHFMFFQPRYQGKSLAFNQFRAAVFDPKAQGLTIRRIQLATTG